MTYLILYHSVFLVVALCLLSIEPVLSSSASKLANIIIRIKPKAGNLEQQQEEPIEIYTTRAQFGSRDDISGILQHSPANDLFLCGHTQGRNEALPILPKPTYNMILLVPRGYCTFERKAYAATQYYGAKGILIYDQLDARYQWDDTTQRVIFPQQKQDYECSNGFDVLYKLTLDPPAYNGTLLNPLLDMKQQATSICNLSSSSQSYCESQLCLVTSHQEDSTVFPVCCAWDLPIAMEMPKDGKRKDTKNIVAAFLTIRQSEEVVRGDLLGSEIVIESLDVVVFNVSYIFMWMLGTMVSIYRINDGCWSHCM
jgi:hypothetical protein